MSDILFSLNITVPVFLLMVFGMIFRKINWISEDFANAMNKFVFRFALPVSVFKSMATSSFEESMDYKFVLLCALCTLGTIVIAIILAHFFVKEEVRGEFIQSNFRSNTALLGMALVSGVYPNTVYAPLMMLGCVPIYNITSVAVLTIYSSDGKGNGQRTVKRILLGIIKNPIIIGLVIGIVWSLLGLPYPDMLSKTVGYFANLATPMGLMAMGATFQLKQAASDLKPALLAVWMKLIGYTVLFLPVAYLIGYRGEAMLSFVIMTGASQAVASYSMAINMGHKGNLTSLTLMSTTLLCGFTLTFWIYILRIIHCL